ncbi:kxDL motif-containing protein 1-like [Saccostrea echinata]|uniref:kxDL motif-containing protein 1-like n=1 Tax=Saccostrea echinata TaxID=191078 RepID=UPI002A7EB07B|nr:kxDL motif-containing protein 1-like [Saccostrea echinata]
MSTTTEENDEDEISIEPSRAFTEALVEQVNREDVQSMVQLQRDMLARYEKTNEMLINFNMLSSARCEATSQEFRQHTQVLGQMKADLDIIFRRIRTLKQRLGTLYPEAFAACSDVYNILENSEEEEHTEKCPVKVCVTDTTKNEKDSEQPQNGANKLKVEHVSKDQTELSEQFQSSCAVNHTDSVEANEYNLNCLY